jgi:hypothetical protein
VSGDARRADQNHRADQTQGPGEPDFTPIKSAFRRRVRSDRGATGAPAGDEPSPTEASEDVPELSGAQTTVQMEVENSDLFADKDATGTAEGTVILVNGGTGDATDVQISGRFSDGTDAGIDELIETIPANDSVTKGGTLLITSSESAPLTIPFTVRATVNGSVFGWSSLIAAAAAFVMTFVSWRRVKVNRRDDGLATKERPPLGYVVFPGASWSFTGSWATSLTGVGAILGLILSASGLLSDVLPGLAVGLIAGVNIAYLLLVGLAALVFKASHDVDARPTYGAFLLAGFVTLWAVVGELLTIAQLAGRGGVPWAALWTILAVMTLFIYLYQERSGVEIAATFIHGVRAPVTGWKRRS